MKAGGGRERLAGEERSKVGERAGEKELVSGCKGVLR